MNWKASLKKIIYPTEVLDTYLERGEDIKDILDHVSKYDFDPIATWKNIKGNKDFAILDFIAALQSYIYGSFDISILHSCFSVEIGLVTILDHELTKNEKEKVKQPSLGDIIKLCDKRKVLDNDIISGAYKILDIRNTHIHRVNLISGLILTYQGYNLLLSNMGIELENLEENFSKLSEHMPEEVFNMISSKYKPSDITEAYETIQKLSTFEWAANEKFFSEIKSEVDGIVQNMTQDLLNLRFYDFGKYFENIILRKRALRTIKLTFNILKNINII